MSTQTTTYTTAGSHTYTAPATLLGGSVVVTVYGSPGANIAGGPAGAHGGKVIGTVTVAPGGTLTAIVGDTGTNGQHAGAAGSAGGGGGVTGAHGGGSSAILNATPTLLLEAAGGGGGGGGGIANDATGGAGGAGGLTFGHGTAGARLGALGIFRGGGGGGGGGNQGVGSAGRTGSTGAGGATVGQGGDSAVSITNTEAGGGGGAGGSSFAAGAGVSAVTFTDGGSVTAGSVVIVATVADAPLAPTLVSPTNGAYVDSNGAGVTFDWTYNPGTNSGSQNAYALRVSQDGAAYQYWNATSVALQAGIVWNASSSSAVAVPAGKLADGHVYTWSVATQESDFSLQGTFASDLLFNANAQPTATVTAPSGTISVAAPTVVWSEVLGGGLSQTAFRVVIYTAAVVAGGGFSPGVTTGTVDSGVVSSAALSWPVPGGTPLTQGAWVAYVQITETGSIVSQWASSAFTVAYDPPASPSLTGVVTNAPTGLPTVTLTVTAFDNLLSADDASFEASLGTFTAGANTTAVQSATQAEDGANSMRLTATASGSVVASTSSTVYAVTGGNGYAAMASFRAAATARSCTVAIAWFTAGNSLISTSTSGTATDSTSAWTVASIAATAPGTAAFAKITVTVAGCAAAEIHYVDEVGLYLAGAVPLWSRGGLIGIQLASIVYSDDGGNTWLPLRGATLVGVPTSTEQITAVDYESLFGPTRQYQATISANVTTPVPGTVTSVPSSVFAATIPSGPWWLTDPLDPTTALQFSRLGTSGGTSLFQISSGGAATTTVQVPISAEFDSAETMGVFSGWGNPNPIIQRGTVQSKTFMVAGYIVGYAQYAIWQSLTGRVPMSNGQVRQRTLLLRSDMGDAWYVAVGPSLADQLLRAPDRVTSPQWIITIPCIVTSKP